jgi:hypothetical protein
MTIFEPNRADGLASPERLDQLLRVTTLRGWVMLGSVGAVLVAALVWGFAGSVATTVTGEGILVRGGRVTSVAAFPSTARGMALTIAHDELVEQFMVGGAAG